LSLPILREYQTDARYQINTLLNAGRSPCLVISTGCGKTKTACTVISDRIDLGERVFVLVPNIEAFGQWMHELTECGLEPGYINDEGMKGRARMVYVCMPISMLNLIQNIPESLAPDIFVIDEAHHTAADSWLDIFDFYPNRRKLGLTATPRRIDNKPLTMYTDIVSTITMHDAVERGFLARPLVIVPEEWQKKLDIPNEDIDTRQGLEKQAAALGGVTIIGDVIRSYGEVFHGLPVLVACSTFGHAKAMAAAFTTAGWKFEHIHSGLPTAERKRMLRQIRSGDLHGLCTVGIGVEALDIPGLYGLIWLRRTMSVTIYLQFIGRVLRPMPGKQYGVILDPVGNLFIHGFPDAERKWTLDGEAPERTESECPTMKICPRCGVANAVGNLTCHMCGLDFSSDEAHEARRRELPTVIDGNLVAVTSDGMARRVSEMIDEAKQSTEETLDKKAEPVRLSKNERAEYLAGGLFAGTMKRKAFNEALEGWRR
jgi:DNA repair protein RadD